MRADQSREKYVMALIRVIEDAPSVVEGCRRVGIHRSTYYRWKHRLSVGGSVVSSGRRVSVQRRMLESEVVACALAHPGWGPNLVYAMLVERQVPVGSPSQVWRILKHHGLNQARYRFEVMRLAIGMQAPDNLVMPGDRPTPRYGVLHADQPGDLVQMDCFHLGRVKGAKIAGYGQGTVWQYTAIDVASSYVWAEIHTSRHNPDPVHTTSLAHRVANDLASHGWRLKAITTDNGNEFRSTLFTNTLESLTIDHRRITPGRPQTNGKVEQVQATLLRELWHPAFVSYQQPSITGLRQDLHDYLTWYNTTRPHTGRWNQGTPPIHIIEPNNGNHP